MGNYSVVNLNGLERAIPEEETYVFYLLKSVISRQYLVIL